MAIRRFKSRATAGRLLKSGTLAQLTDLADIRVTKFRGDGDAGTLQGIIDSAGAVTTVGCLVLQTRYASGTVSSAGAYNATGVIYGAGSYATEASRNSATAGAGQILTGYSITLLGSTTNGSYTPGGPGYTYGDNDASQVLTTADGPGTYHAPEASEVIFGANVGTTTGTFFGVCSSTGVTAASGIIDWIGDKFSTGILASGGLHYASVGLTNGQVQNGVNYKDESGLHLGSYDPITGNYTDPGKAFVLIGNNYYFAGVLQVAAYAGGGGYVFGDNNASFVLTTAIGPGDYVPIADSDTVDGGVSFGDGEVGTGVNATTAQAAAAAALAAYGASILTAQNVRDSMKLAPTAGAPEAGSVDKHLDDVVGGAPVSLTTETTIIESD